MAAFSSATSNHRLERSVQSDEISKYLTRLKEKKDNLEQSIKYIETEINRYEDQLQAISKKKSTLVMELDEKRRALDNLNQTVQDSESTYQKLVESSQTLLALIKKESMEVDKNLSKTFG